MTSDLNGLDKIAQRRTRPVTPPRRPAPTKGTPGSRPAPAPPVATLPAPAARAATRTPPPRPAAPAVPEPEPPVIARGAATEQLGVRLHRHQIRQLRRTVRLLDEEQHLYRPTQAELIQVLVEDLPDQNGAALDALAERIRDYRRRVTDAPTG